MSRRLDFLEKTGKEKVLGAIQKSNELSDEVEKNLKSAIEEFKKIFE